jgi:hypothetical protein
MFYNVYDNKLLIPGKSGSRFVSSHNWQQEDSYDFPFVESNDRFPQHLKSVEWIVIREPNALLHSAISTEVNSRLTNHIDNGYEKLSIGTITEIIGNVLDMVSTQNTPHYSLNLYKWLYDFTKSGVANKNLKFVHLNDLSGLIKKLGVEGGDIYDRHNYDHSKSPYYISQKLIEEIITSDLLDKWRPFFINIMVQEGYFKKLSIFDINTINMGTKKIL